MMDLGERRLRGQLKQLSGVISWQRRSWPGGSSFQQQLKPAQESNMGMLDARVQTTATLTRPQITQLAKLGLRIVQRLPGDAYRIRGSTEASIADLLALPFVHSATPFHPQEKLDSTLASTVQLLATAPPTVRGALREGLAAAAPSVPSLNLLITLDAEHDTKATNKALAALGKLTAHSPRRAMLQTSPERIAQIAALDGVLHVEIEPDTHTQNNVARTLTGIEPLAASLALEGAGEIVGVADSGLDTGVVATVLGDFAGRVVNIRSNVNKAAFGVADGADLNNHGTHVCGSIASDGANSNGTIRGMAPAAQLTVLSMGPDSGTGLSVPADLVTGVFNDAYADGARIHSNSWGANNNLGKYTAFSQDVDEFAWNHRDMLVVIAAGNSGPGASTVSAPGTAKNCLTVGASESVRPLPASISIDPNLQDQDFNPATPDINVPLTLNGIGQQADNADDIASFSGQGPLNDTGDNRTKPDIVAPGTFILSCRSSVSIADIGPDGLPHVGAVATFYADDSDGAFTHAEAVGRGLPGAPFFGAWNQNTPAPPPGAGALAQQNYFYDSGTSMATPITSGAIAVLRQYLRQRRGIANPSAALLKALVVNAATVPAAASTSPDNTRGFGWLNLNMLLTPPPTGQQAYSDDTALAVATGDVRQFSVQVADTSQPLRITLVWTDRQGKGLQNKLYLRVLPPGGGPAIDGDITAFPNPRNNVQRVHIAAPVAGAYTVEVHGIDVAFGIPALAPALRQDFALAVINGIGFSPNPIDVAQVIDHSGSMGFYSFMQPARERAKQFVDVLRINDRAGVVQFDHTVSTVSPVSPITGFGSLTALKTAIDTIVPAGATSIGGGLTRAVADLAAGGDPTHPQAIVLLSDGHENTPPWVGGGVTDSPPSWYTGGNLTEALPGVPASIKIYTVSLGVASDEVLLQDLANARGGLFQAIHSAAEIGKLHEIYVHLQALVGGEEVIAAGSDSVDGIGAGGDTQSSRASALSRASELGGYPELAGLITPGSALSKAMLAAVAPLEKVHSVPVDDTVTSAVFLVSWHDLARPVALRVVTPSLKVITASSVTHHVVNGSSYQLIRVERPEPGLWTLHVQAAKAATPGGHPYSWGVQADTPIRLQLKVPRKVLGKTTQTFEAILSDTQKLVKSIRFAAKASSPTVSIANLLKKYDADLKRIETKIKPDTPKISIALTKLAILDLMLVSQGKPSIFVAAPQKVALTGKGATRKASFSAAVSGISSVDFAISGTTRRGFRFSRVARFDLRR